MIGTQDVSLMYDPHICVMVCFTHFEKCLFVLFDLYISMLRAVIRFQSFLKSLTLQTCNKLTKDSPTSNCFAIPSLYDKSIFIFSLLEEGYIMKDPFTSETGIVCLGSHCSLCQKSVCASSVSIQSC